MAPSSVRLPPNPKVEIEFTAGVWTDVTADVYPDVIAPNTRFGRTSPFSGAQSAQFSVALDNSSQKYTPQNTGSPYYPNIQRRKRIRYSYNPGVQRMRFVGYIKQWKPTLIDPGSTGAAFYPVMQISAQCRMDQFSRVTMLSPIRQEITIDKPLYWWPLAEDQGSLQALEQSGNSGPALSIANAGGALAFGDNGPGFGDGTGVKFAGGQILLSGASGANNFFGDTELWVQRPTVPGAAEGVLNLDGTDGVAPLTIGIDTTGKPTVTGVGPASLTGTASICDGGWHHVFLSFAGSSGGTRIYTLYVDGVSVATQTVSVSAALRQAQSRIGVGSAFGLAAFNGNIGQVALYGANNLSSTRIMGHAAAGFGYYGDLTHVRISRFIGYAGLTASDWTLDTGQVTVNTYPQAGVDVLTACSDMATSEGGGSVFYVDTTGSARFINRRYRDNRTPKITLVAAGDLDPSVYEPSLDDDGLVTRVSVNRASESGTQTTQTYDSGAIDVFASQVTTYTISDQDALALAQWMVNSQTTQALRFPQVAIYLDQADHDLYDTVGQLGIGDRVRVNFPAVAYPVPVVDFFVEGFADQPDPASGGYRYLMDISPADNPAPRAIWDLSTWDGGDVWAL